MNRLQVQLLETQQADDIRAGVAFVRTLQNVERGRVAVVGHSFGGSVALFVGERDSSLRAIVDFAGAAGSWSRSPELQARLKTAVSRIAIPVLFLHAANDYSTEPGQILAAEMEGLGKRHRLVIYPPSGNTAFDGHNFIDRAVKTWESDVFAFLDAYVKQ